MLKKGSLFIVGADGTFLDDQRGKLRAFDNFTSVVQVLAPFDTNTVVEVSYLIYGANNETIPQYVAPTEFTGADVLAPTHSLYQTCYNWVLWEIEVTQRALAKISKYKVGQIGIGFSFKERFAPAQAITNLGTFGLYNNLPPTASIGQYYLCDRYNFVSGALTFTKNDYAVWNGIAWTKPLQYTLVQNTTTINLQVSGALLSVVATTLDEDDEFLFTFAQTQGDVMDIITGTQIVGEAIKATNDADDNDIVATYETKLDATTHKNRTDNPHSVTKAQVGLGNADNTSDANKPISSATQIALDTKVSRGTTIIGIDLQDDITLEEFKIAVGNATQSSNGWMSDTDKLRLDELWALMAVDDGDSFVDTLGEVLQIFQNYPEGADLVTILAGKVDKVTGRSLVDDDLITKLNELYTKAQIDTLLDTKIDKLMDYSSLLATQAEGNETLPILDNGVIKKIALNEIYQGANAATGSVIDTGTYKELTAGATMSVLAHDLVFVANGDFKINIDTIALDKIIFVQFPVTTSTSLLRVSVNNGTTYYNVLKNGARFKASIVSGQLVRLLFDGTNFIADIQGDVEVVETYDDKIESTFGSFNPHDNGVPIIKEISGRTIPALSNLVTNGDFSIGQPTSTPIGWSFYGMADKYANNYELALLPNVQYANANQTITSIIGHKYYVGAYVKSASNEVYLDVQIASIFHTGNSQYQKLSLVITETDTTLNVYIGTAQTNSYSEIYAKNVIVIDLTATFGSGNEPTVAEMDAIIEALGTSGYISSTPTTHVENSQFKSVGKNLFDKTQLVSALATVSQITNGVRLSGTYYAEYPIDNLIIGQPYTMSWIATTVSGTPAPAWLIYYTDDTYTTQTASGNSLTPTKEVEKIFLYLESSAVSSVADFTNIQLELGTVATTYAPYNTETQLFNHSRLSKLPNGVADKIRYDNGAYVLDRYVQEVTLTSEMVTSVFTGYDNIDVALISKPSNASGYNNSTLSWFHLDGYYEVEYMLDLVENIGKVNSTFNSTLLAIGYAKATTLGQAQTALAGTKIWYQLATPILAQSTLDVDGTLIQESVTTVEQMQNIPTTYQIEFAMNTEQTTKTLVQRDKIQQQEIDNLETTKYTTGTDLQHSLVDDDLRAPFTRTQQNPTTLRPDYDATNLGLLFPQNDETEVVDFIFQLPHGYKPGTPLFPHIHVVQAQNAQAKFVVEYKLYNQYGGAIPASWTQYVLDTYAVTDAYSTPRSQVIRGNSAGISGTGITESAILKVRLYRQTGDGYTGDILADELDIRVFMDKPGLPVAGRYTGY